MTQTDPAQRDEPARPGRRWFQFSLRTLLILTAVLSALAGLLARWSYKARQQRDAVAALERDGVEVKYDFQARTPQQRLVWPNALLNALGIDYFANVSELKYIRRTDISSLHRVNDLKGLECLYFYGTPLPDSALEKLSGLTGLRELTLNATGLSDAELENLRGLVSLQELNITANHVTEAGVARLQQALPYCKIIH